MKTQTFPAGGRISTLLFMLLFLLGAGGFAQPDIDIQGFCVEEPTRFSVKSPVPLNYVAWEIGSDQESKTHSFNVVAFEHSFEAAGRYYVSLISGTVNGMDTTVVNFEINQKPPEFDLGPDTSICYGQSLLLQTGLEQWPHLWSDGSRNSSIGVSKSGTYEVEVGKGCVRTDRIEVIFEKEIRVHLPKEVALCPENKLRIDPGAGAGHYLWSNGATDRFLDIDSLEFPTTYVLWAGWGECVEEHSVKVIPRQMPEPDLPDQITLFVGEFTQLGPQMQPGFQYEWSNGKSGSPITVEKAGTYHLRMYDAYGCMREDSTHVLTQSSDCENVNLGMDRQGEGYVFEYHNQKPGRLTLLDLQGQIRFSEYVHPGGLPASKDIQLPAENGLYLLQWEGYQCAKSWKLYQR